MQSAHQRLISQAVAGALSVAPQPRSADTVTSATLANLTPPAPWYDRSSMRRQSSPVHGKATASRSPQPRIRTTSPSEKQRIPRTASPGVSKNLARPILRGRATSPTALTPVTPTSTPTGNVWAATAASAAVVAAAVAAGGVARGAGGGHGSLSCRVCSPNSQLTPSTATPVQTAVPTGTANSARSGGVLSNSPPTSASSTAALSVTPSAPLSLGTGQEAMAQCGQFGSAVTVHAHPILGDADADGGDLARGAGTRSAADPMAVRSGSGGTGSVAGKLYRVACCFTSVGEDTSQLSLVAGDLVRVQCRDPSGWTYGRLECPSGGNGADRSNCVARAGWFPEALLIVDEAHAEPGAEDERADQKRADTIADTAKDALVASAAPMWPPDVDAVSEAPSMEAPVPEFMDDVPTRSCEQVQLGSSAAAELDKIRRECDLGGTVPDGNGSATMAAILASNADPWDRCLRMTGLEEEKVRRCERKLAEVARSRRRYLGACESAVKGTTEAEEAVAVAERVLASLEEQERKCRSEICCVASSTSTSMRQAAEAKLRTLEVKKQNASMNLVEAQERLDCERHAFGVVRDRLRAESQTAVVAVEALSRQRLRANTTLRNLAHASGLVAAVPSSEAAKPSLMSSSSSPPAEERRPPKSAAAGQCKQVEAPRMARSRAPSARRQAGATASRGASGLPSSGAPPPRSNPSRSNLRCRTQSQSPSPQKERGESRRSISRAHSRDQLHVSGPSRRQTTPSKREMDRTHRSKVKDVASSRPDSSEAPKKATEIELNHMLDVLQTAEALQAKLAAMPEHLRAPLAKHCASLHGITPPEIAREMSSEEIGAAQAELLAALG